MTTSADVLNTVLTICAPLLTLVVTAAVWKLREALHMNAIATDKANLESEVRVSVGAGIAAVARHAPEILTDGITTPQGMMDVAAAAADFFKLRFPDRAAQIATAAGMETDLGRDAALRQSISARLPIVNPVTTLTAAPGMALGAVETGAATTLPVAPLGAALPPAG